jgi:hypothetical protein
MEPSEDDVAKNLRLDANACGSIDLRETYFQIVKDNNVFKGRKPEPRKFVPGNTAFRNMGHLPLLPKDHMTTVSYKDREAVFRGVTGSDQWTHAKKDKSSQAGPTASAAATESSTLYEDDDAMQVDDEAAQAEPGIVPPDSQVVFFWMELHPRVTLAPVSVCRESFLRRFTLCQAGSCSC